LSKFLEKRRNKAILIIYFIFIFCITVSTLAVPVEWKGKLFLFCFNTLSATGFTFIIYIVMNKIMKD